MRFLYLTMYHSWTSYCFWVGDVHLEAGVKQHMKVEAALDQHTQLHAHTVLCAIGHIYGLMSQTGSYSFTVRPSTFIGVVLP